MNIDTDKEKVVELRLALIEAWGVINSFPHSLGYKITDLPQIDKALYMSAENFESKDLSEVISVLGRTLASARRTINQYYLNFGSK